MKIYSDYITKADVRAAFTWACDVHGADILIEDIRAWKPRRYASGVEVWAESLHGKRATGHVPARASGPRDGYPRAASWDDWGYVIAYLYNIDPHARVGFYDNEADFVAKVRKSNRGSDFLNVLDNIKEYGE